MLLAADLGGTNARFALFDGTRLVRRNSLPAAEYPSITAALRAFLSPAESVEATCLAVAGPVTSRVCEMTNLAWRVDADQLERELPLGRVVLVNDFEAVAWGVDVLPPDEVVVLQAGERDANGARVILGAGTGLGKAVVVPAAGGLRVLKSEGGHVDFAPRNDVEDALLQHLRAKHGRVSLERVVSGTGLRAIYAFLVESGRVRTDAALRDRILAGDAGAEIAACAGHDAACAEALTRFVSLYGAAAGNQALEVLPSGGMFIAGGIAPKLIDRLREPAFLDAFLDKGRMRSLLERVYVAVVMASDVGLRGAARCAAELTRAS